MIKVFLLVLLFFVAEPPLGWVYLAGVIAVALLLVYEHWLVKPDDLSRVNAAFFTVNVVISIGMFALILADQFVRAAAVR